MNYSSEQTQAAHSPAKANMAHSLQFYIDGAWSAPSGSRTLEVINPATEAPYARIALGELADVDLAVAAAQRAFISYSRFTRAEKLDLLESLIAIYTRHYDEMAATITSEMGAPLGFARDAQAAMGLHHLKQAASVLRSFQADERIGDTVVTREPIGVCALITPWNWPMNQIACKVGPALATGCTVVLKPSEVAPMSGLLFTEFVHEAGVPAGVYNMVNGDGATVGQALSSHPGVDMVSFTGSTRAGVAVARAAANTIKRVTQELGGKSPNIILPDADFANAVAAGARNCFSNSGQSCNAPTRMLVPSDRQEEAIRITCEIASSTRVGDPVSADTTIGPVVSQVQYDKIQGLIEAGINEGARLVAGGLGRPEGLDRGYFVRPTVFANVRNDMTIAREEIFGPVLAILPYDTVEDAITIANDTPYGLSSYISGTDIEQVRQVARRIQAGMVHINNAASNMAAAFGGYKQSGNGREWGKFGFEDFLEIKSMFGYDAT